MTALHLPPLFSALATAGADPFEVAQIEARQGCDAGLVCYDIQPERLRAAMVFAPEVPLREAAIMLPLCGVGFQNALGALAPPEVSLHLEWSGAVRLNGAVCGHLRLAAEPSDPAAVPDWLVVGLELALWDPTEETGLTPEITTLYAEGCSEVDPSLLIEAWVRHTLVWLNRWLDDGVRPLFAEWKGLAHGLNEQTQLDTREGVFLGVDESFGMLLKSGGETVIIPLTDLLKEPA
jgi:biotin-(acetyl-CoA carboxylase) ligase